jgi:hypothetical protein
VPAFLIAMDPVIGGVEAQDQFLGRLGKRGDELFQQYLVEGQSRLAIRPLLQSAKRRCRS